MESEELLAQKKLRTEVIQLEDMLAPYERAVRRSGRSLAIWEKAYNEENLDGWTIASPCRG